MELSLADITAVVIYFLLVLGIGFWVGTFHWEALMSTSAPVNGQTSPWDCGGIFPGREVHVLAAGKSITVHSGNVRGPRVSCLVHHVIYQCAV